MDTIKLEDEVKEALDCIEKGENFILEGGAGSGKTFSLISIIGELANRYPDNKIICITYTNNAVAEISSRVESDNIWISTIHEFIWSIIKQFQFEIKYILVELINDDNEKKFKKPDIINQESITIDYFKDIFIDYDEYYRMTSDNQNYVSISHDHILIIAEKMFAEFTKLSDILKDFAQYIFIDEYQDTAPEVAKILLTHLEKSNKKNIIGFFGDSMQSIYDSGVGDLEDYNLHKIIKKQNRRNPLSIITLANKFRNDNLKQIPSKDTNAPNMNNGEVIRGTAKFYYSINENKDELSKIKNMSYFKSWDFSDGTKTKELRLTHGYNAEQAGFEELFILYKKDCITKLIKKINKNISKSDRDKKTLKDLVVDEDLVKEIINNKRYNCIYNKIKDWSVDEVYAKTRINKDSLLSYKLDGLSGRYEAGSHRDIILKRLDLLEEIINLYLDNKLNKFLKVTKFSIQDQQDKVKLKNIIDKVSDQDNKTIKEVLEYAEYHGLIKEDELFNAYISSKGWYLWERIKNIPFKEYRCSIEYLKEFSPICTQHSVKGSEYDNVLIILESNWNKYDFATLFEKGSSTKSVINRTKKLFYVCITRAKQHVAVYMPTNDREIINTAKDFFGKDNVVPIEDEF
ncbi:ATP-dependent helicase [Dolosigranulum pigrum]|uniref:UvrD-helicase domain-containing protein n=1 Tax=Dolosigranulum pigrum TaxID=29394 RepID=UPI000DC39DC0|nr:ATP-dependent helicase [Dolosigranulum pigrum]